MVFSEFSEGIVGVIDKFVVLCERRYKEIEPVGWMVIFSRYHTK
jgi:hypothetical protein